MYTILYRNNGYKTTDLGIVPGGHGFKSYWNTNELSPSDKYNMFVMEAKEDCLYRDCEPIALFNGFPHQIVIFK